MKTKTKKISKLVTALGLGLSISLSQSSLAAEFKIALGDGGGSAQEAFTKEFTKLLSEKSDHTTSVFLNGQLGSEQDTVNDAALGVLDFSVVGSVNLVPFSPSLGMYNLPYIFNNLDDVEKAINSSVTDEIVKNTIRDSGVRIVGWTYSGFRVLSNSKKPVTKLDDLQNLIVRTPKNEILIDTYKSWGNNPTPIAWAEVFTALQQGVVDGQENPYITIYSMKFGEVQKYITDTHYNFLLEPMIVSEQVFQEQDKATQKAILEAGQEATQYSLNWLIEKEAAIKKELISKYNMEIHSLEDEAEWAKRAQDAVWPKFYDSVGGKEKVNELLRTLGRDEV